MVLRRSKRAHRCDSCSLPFMQTISAERQPIKKQNPTRRSKCGQAAFVAWRWLKKRYLDIYTSISILMCMKRTNIVLDEKLVGKGMRLTGIQTQKGLIDYALRELVRRKEQKKILRLKGKVSWEGDLDQMRTNRF